MLVILLLFVPSLMSCQGKNSGETVSGVPAVEAPGSIRILMDPFLLHYLKNFPTLILNTSENAVIQRLSYKDFDRRERNLSEAGPGTSQNSIYLFKNGVFNGIDHAFTNDKGLQSRYKGVEITRSSDGLILGIAQYEPRINLNQDGWTSSMETGRLSQQHAYKKNNNITIVNDGLRRGAVCALVVEEESKISYFGSYQRYNETPDRPDTTMEFMNGDVIISEYGFLLKQDISRFYFTNGILMKKEYMKTFNRDQRTETYTVNSGKGEIIVTDASGTVIERSMLERRINAAGYLEYEAVKYPAGNGYELFFTKDTLK